MAIAIKERESEVYEMIAMKAGSYQVIRCTVLVVQGESIRQGRQETCGNDWRYEWKVSMIAKKEREDDTTEATKVGHAHIWANKLEELVAWIGGEGLGIERQGLGLQRGGVRRGRRMR